MKLKLFLYLAVLLCLAHTLAVAGSINDTVWTSRNIGMVTGVVISPDGSKIVVSTNDSVVVLTSKDGQLLNVFLNPVIGKSFVTPDNSTCIFYSYKDSSLYRYNLQTGKQEISLPFPNAKHYSYVDYNANGDYAIASIMKDDPNPPRIGLGWTIMNTKTGEVRQTKLYPSLPKYLDVHVEETMLSSTGDTAIVHVYRSYGNGNNKWTNTNEIILYDVATGDSIGVFPVFGYDMFKSNNNQYYVVIKDSVVTIVNSKMQITYTKNFHNPEYHISSISDDGKIFALARYMNERTMEVWDLERNEIVWKNNIGAVGMLLSPIKDFYIALYTIGVSYYHNKTNTSSQDNTGGKILLFPNPTTGELLLRFSLLNSGVVSYSITDLKGITLINGAFGYQESGEHSQPIHVNMLPSGTYYLRLQTPDGITTYNVTITK